MSAIVSDISFGVSSYEIVEITPNKAVIRVHLEDNLTQDSVYNHENQQNGFKYVADIILEAGKHGATIIPYMSKPNYGIGLNISYYHDVSDDLGVLGLEDTHIPEVLGAIQATFEIPLVLSMRHNASHITGFHGRKKTTLSQDSDDIDTFVATSRLRNIQDEQNTKEVFGVFSKNYDDFKFIEGEDFNTISATISDSNASGGQYGKVNNNSTGIWTIGTLSKGAYVALVRMKRSAYGRCTFKLEENGTARESYGWQLGNAADTFYVDINYKVYALPFCVNDTDSYNIDIGTSSLDSGDTHVDFAMVIPLNNGKDSVFDLMLQNLAIFDQEYVGVIK